MPIVCLLIRNLEHTKFELCVGYVPSQKGFQHLAIESSTTPEVIHVGGGVGLDAKGKLIIILSL